MERMTKEDEDGVYTDNVVEAIKKLAAYEDICPDPERLKEIDKLYLEKCREVRELRAQLGMGQTDAADISDAEKLAYTE